METKIQIFEKGDYTQIGELLWEKNSQACEDCLIGMYVWKDYYGLSSTTFEHGMAIHAALDDSWLYPLPLWQSKEVIEEMRNTYPSLLFHRITQEQKEQMEQWFPGQFLFEEEDGNFDYLYEVETLALLKGKKLAKKRNHINAFLAEQEDWQVEEITEDNLPECRQFSMSWYDQKMQDMAQGGFSLTHERKSLFAVLDHYKELGADGVLLRAEGECVAFAIGQRISEHTFDVVFEKAQEEVRGAYNMINREFVRYLQEKYPELKWINRENDLGLPGLRKAKRSYLPSQLLIKYTAKTRSMS